MEMQTGYPTFSEIAKTITNPVVLDAADKSAAFMAWLLEKPDVRLPAWVAATEHED